MTPRRVRDADGDTWEESHDSEWVELNSHSWLPSLEILERLWGPLTELSRCVGCGEFDKPGCLEGLCCR